MGLVTNIPRGYTALAEVLAITIYVLLLKKRLGGVKLYLTLAVSYLLILGVHLVAEYIPDSLWLLGMFSAVALMYFTILAVSKVNKATAVYWTARAFIMAELVASIAWQLYFNVAKFFGDVDSPVIRGSIVLIVYCSVFLSLYFIESRYASKGLQLSSRNIVFSAVLCLTAFVVSNIALIQPGVTITGENASEVFFIRTLVDLCAVIVFVAQQEQRLIVKAKLEAGNMENLVKRQYEQYVLNRDNIQALDRKYHDLKHQIQVIRSETNKDKANAYLDKLETQIQVYEAQHNTGNAVLDTILTTKSVECVDKKINFTCVVNGSIIKFIDVMDICSIFGNALDNAIESVSKIVDEEKRLIKLMLFERGSLVVMKIENYYEHKLSKGRDGYKTTKEDKDNHGVGVKSIRYLVDKYKGSISIDTKNNWFRLSLLIPKPE